VYSTLAPRSAGREGLAMVKNLEDLQQVSKENVELTMKSFGEMSKGAQAIATEVADYSKKSFEDSSAMLEKLFGVKSIEKAIELQTEFAKSSYEGFVAKMTKIGEMYSDLAKEGYKPFETMMAKAK
jgi:phasin family protein